MNQRAQKPADHGTRGLVKLKDFMLIGSDGKKRSTRGGDSNDRF